MDPSSCPNCKKKEEQSEKFQILHESQKDWITKLQKELQQTHQLLAQVKRKNQEVNNELVKSNIRAQKELQEAEKKTRELVQRVSHLEKELSLHEAQSEKYQNERDGEKEKAKLLEDEIYFLRERVIPSLDQIQRGLNDRSEALKNLNFSPLQTTSELERSFELTPPLSKDKEKEPKRKPTPALFLPPQEENLEENQPLETSTFWELSSIKPQEEPTPTPAKKKGEAIEEKTKKRKREKRKERRSKASAVPLREVGRLGSDPTLLTRTTRRKDPVSYKEPSRKKKMRREF